MGVTVMTWLKRDTQPGERFLRCAAALIGDRLTQAVIVPAVADFRHELSDARQKRVRRVLVRCRWYCALCCLSIVAPYRVATSSPPRVLANPPAPRGDRLLFLLAATLFVGTAPFFGPFMSAALIAGSLLALVMRAWHARHPSLLRDPAGPIDPAAPEINLSAIHVGGDVAGLVFAAGSTIVVLVGMPQLWWYFAGALLSSLLVAWRRATRVRYDAVIALGISTRQA